MSDPTVCEEQTGFSLDNENVNTERMLPSNCCRLEFRCPFPSPKQPLCTNKRWTITLWVGKWISSHLQQQTITRTTLQLLNKHCLTMRWNESVTASSQTANRWHASATKNSWLQDFDRQNCKENMLLTQLQDIGTNWHGLLPMFVVIWTFFKDQNRGTTFVCIPHNVNNGDHVSAVKVKHELLLMTDYTHPPLVKTFQWQMCINKQV